MSNRISSAILVFLASLVLTCTAGVQGGHSQIHSERLQQQADAASGPYPASGFRPERQFSLPTLGELQFLQQRHQSQPSSSYLAPIVQLQQVVPAQQQEQKRAQKLQKKRERLIQRQKIRTLPQQRLRIVGSQPEQPLKLARLRESGALAYRVPFARRPSNEAGAENFDGTNEIETFSPQIRQPSRLTGSRKETAEDIEDDDDEDVDGSVESTTEHREKVDFPSVPAVPKPVPPILPQNPVTTTFVTFYPQTATGFVRPATYVQLPVTSNIFPKFQLPPAYFSSQTQPLLAQPIIRPLAALATATATSHYQRW